MFLLRALGYDSKASIDSPSQDYLARLLLVFFAKLLNNGAFHEFFIRLSKGSITNQLYVMILAEAYCLVIDIERMNLYLVNLRSYALINKFLKMSRNEVRDSNISNYAFLLSLF